MLSTGMPPPPPHLNGLVMRRILDPYPATLYGLAKTLPEVKALERRGIDMS